MNSLPRGHDLALQAVEHLPSVPRKWVTSCNGRRHSETPAPAPRFRLWRRDPAWQSTRARPSSPMPNCTQFTFHAQPADVPFGPLVEPIPTDETLLGTRFLGFMARRLVATIVTNTGDEGDRSRLERFDLWCTGLACGSLVLTPGHHEDRTARRRAPPAFGADKKYSFRTQTPRASAHAAKLSFTMNSSG